MKRWLAIGCLLARLAVAQDVGPTPAKDAPPAGSISGALKDAKGNPVQDAAVHTKSAQAVTDAHGHYRLANLPAGTYAIQAYVPPGTPSGKKVIHLEAGQDFTSADLLMAPSGSIWGRVLDENKEPLPGITVFLIGSAYSLGQLRHVFVKIADTNDKGEFLFPTVDPHSGYVLQAAKMSHQLDAASEVPADYSLRKRVNAATFYGGSSVLEGAQAITVTEGARLEGMDITLKKAPSYCISGKLTAGGRAKALDFSIEDASATSGDFGDSGLYKPPAAGKSADDGKIRVCELTPGQYKLTVTDLPEDQSATPPFFGTAMITVSDRDVTGIQVGANPRVPVVGHVVWDGKPPDPPSETKLSLYLMPLTRAPWMGEFGGLSAKATVPGDFSFPGLSADDYRLRIYGQKGDQYVKDVTYADSSILRLPLTIGKALGTPDLRVIVGQDGGHIQVTVRDKDGVAVPDSNAVLMPETAGSGASLADALVSGQADQSGSYLSNALAPGKYYVLASDTPADSTPATMDKLWRARTKAQEIEVSANQTAQVTLTPLTLE